MTSIRFPRGALPCVATLATLLASPVDAHAQTASPLYVVPLATTTEGPASQRIIVKFRDGTPEQRQRTVATQRIADLSAHALRTTTRVVARDAIVPANAGFVGIAPITRLAVGADVVRFSLPLARGDAEAIAREIAKDPSVEYAEAERIAQRTDEPNDPWYSGPIERSGVTYTHLQSDLYDPKGGIAAPGAWAQGARGNGIVVAVLDTGITAHPDLDGNVVDGAGYDFLSDPFFSGRETADRQPGGWDPGDWTHGPPWSTAGCPARDSSWHGTHVAGTIAAVTNNKVGIAGVAGDAKLLPVRVLGHCGGPLADIADAITWASGGAVDGVPANATPAHVINMSLGGGGSCPAYLQSAIDGARARGSTIVVAAGNSNVDAAGATPANCKGVVTVASNGLTGKRAHYSNFGAPVDVAAPGGGRYVNDGSSGALWMPHGFIWSTWNTGKTVPATADYAGMAGTSMAAPHVAGIAALMQGAASEHLAPDIVERYLVGTARAFPATPDQRIGAGIADAGAAVSAVIAGVIPPPQPVRVSSGQLVSNLVALPGQAHAFVIDVPAGASRVTLRTFGGTGDGDMYVRFGSPAGTAAGDHDHASVRPGNNAQIVVQPSQAGEYHVLLSPTRAYHAMHFQATVQ
ncbi:extracellular protease [Lysobacter helvus]|uniref:Extracellular protease n=2 Tax=Lysobacteraceae TaxID=32033 RepID=A0ABM7Q6H1_9GAMM|nr:MULTISPECIES: S8 family peptidase [Lysobacter]BCT92947.1 extracellular protease [Lysobacter caseinilyticus]BCT96099.1 extracellular protease [Lysobacter helvus]